MTVPALTITKEFRLGGVLFDPTSVTLCDPTGAFGIQRSDTAEMVVEADTAMTKSSVGVYIYTFSNPTYNAPYEYWIKYVHQGITSYSEFTLTGPAQTGAATATLLDIRRQFVKECGDYSLIVNGDLTTCVDNGADVYLNRAQRYLDKRCSHMLLDRHYIFTPALNAFTSNISDLLRCEDLFVITTEGRSSIFADYISPGALRAQIGTLVSEWETGTPYYWTLQKAGMAPAQVDLTLEQIATASDDQTEMIVGRSYSYHQLLWYPKATGEFSMDLIGKFYSPALTDDTHTTFWTTQESDLLIQTACLMREMGLRNQSGIAAQSQVVESLLSALDDEVVEMELLECDMANWSLRDEAY